MSGSRGEATNPSPPYCRPGLMTVLTVMGSWGSTLKNGWRPTDLGAGAEIHKPIIAFSFHILSAALQPGPNLMARRKQFRAHWAMYCNCDDIPPVSLASNKDVVNSQERSWKAIARAVARSHAA